MPSHNFINGNESTSDMVFFSSRFITNTYWNAIKCLNFMDNQFEHIRCARKMCVILKFKLMIHAKTIWKWWNSMNALRASFSRIGRYSVIEMGTKLAEEKKTTHFSNLLKDEKMESDQFDQTNQSNYHYHCIRNGKYRWTQQKVFFKNQITRSVHYWTRIVFSFFMKCNLNWIFFFRWKKPNRFLFQCHLPCLPVLRRLETELKNAWAPTIPNASR